jgi:DNA-binding transcriptional regulator GbsR (MarR family)
MTTLPKTYFAKRLLEHGPLTFAEFQEITGWSHGHCAAVLSSLLKSGVAFFTQPMGQRRRMYFLAE